jgi:nucleoside 2-deoxyribosyltransferase
MPPRFYLAGPFFNPEQIELMQRIETEFVEACIPFFSPRMEQGNQKKGPIDAARAGEIYRNNVVNIHDCEAVLAVLDWKMPRNAFITLMTFSTKGEKDVFTRWAMEGSYPKASFSGKGKSLQIPDSGTVFEMGYAAALNKPIVIYTERSLKEPLNLMLTRCSRGVIRGIDELRNFLGVPAGAPPAMKRPGVNWAELKEWEGRNS